MHQIKLDDIDLMKFVGTQESQFVATKDYWMTGVLERLKTGVQHFGDPLPWSKCDDKFRLRPGEVTLWCGINGHGKSILSGMVALWLQRFTKVLIASMEMPPEATLVRMLRQVAGSEAPSEVFAEQFLRWKSNNLHIYDQQDSVPTERIVGLCHYAVHELGVKHLFIDSLMKCGIAPDDYNRQKEFVDRLCNLAKTSGSHIHLIHHVRKGRDENEIPNKFSMKGAGELTDLVDNAVIVWRNKRKEELMYQKSQGADVEVDEEKPDAYMCIDKQRHGEWEGKFALWFHKQSMQYHGKRSFSPMPYEMGGV